MTDEKVKHLYDITGDNKFLSIEEMLNQAKKLEGYDFGVVILVRKDAKNKYHINCQAAKLNTAELLLALEGLKIRLLAQAIR